MEIFDAYAVSSNDKRIAIKAKLVYRGMEKYGYYAIKVAVYFVPLSIIYYWPVTSDPLQLGSILLKLSLMLLLFFIIRPYIERLFSSILSTILLLDKEKNTLTSQLDSDVLKISDITKISIDEEQISENLVYKLKFHLKDGDKTTRFAFTSYQLAEEVVHVIQKATSHNNSSQ